MHDKIKKTLKFSYWDGVFACAMTGLTQDYFAPFLLFLGGTIRQVGTLNALPNLFAALVQLISPDITDHFKSRKKMITTFVFFQAMILSLIVVMILMMKGDPVLLIVLVILFSSMAALAAPAWGSLMADLVSDDKRGDYFGWRNRHLGVITVSASLIAGLILQKFKDINPLFGFLIIFGFAGLCRIVSWIFLNLMHEPVLICKEEDHFTVRDFLLRFKESNYAQFVIFVALLNFSVYIAAPFFAVFMLKDLHFNYLLYSVINIVATGTILMTMHRWGRHADRIGNIKVIQFTAPLTGLIPLMWIINHNPVFLVFAQIFSGLVWSGFNLCSTNFIYDAVTPAKRTRCIAYFNLFNGLALCCGALVGGFIVRYLPNLFGYKILSLFLISGILRAIVGFWGPQHLVEVREIQKINNRELFFSMAGIKSICMIKKN